MNPFDDLTGEEAWEEAMKLNVRLPRLGEWTQAEIDAHAELIQRSVDDGYWDGYHPAGGQQ